MAILTHPVYGSEALRFCTKKTDKTRANITPRRLLVTHMTGSYVFVHVFCDSMWHSVNKSACIPKWFEIKFCVCVCARACNSCEHVYLKYLYLHLV